MPKPSLTSEDGGYKILHEHPFDSTLKRMSVIYLHCPTDVYHVFTKGATEAVLGLCSHVQRGNAIEPLCATSLRPALEREIEYMAQRGLVRSPCCFAPRSLICDLSLSLSC